MTVDTQNVTPVISYSPFEGMSEAQRLTNAVPRGIVRFQAVDVLQLKAINDDLVLNITGSLPANYAYVASAISFNLSVDRATDWNDNLRFRIFNGLPNAAPGNEQVAIFDFEFYNPNVVGTSTQRMLDYQLGTLRDWFPNPIWRSPGAAGISFTLQGVNPSDTASAAGTMFFNMSFYQYDLTQAVRYPLNFPFPVGVR